ncbi:hypothetical protein FM124_03425 [Pediococcus acidilactici]|nr:hypothetical protein FM124_03425 [Pediococcus acidilactici]
MVNRKKLGFKVCFSYVAVLKATSTFRQKSNKIIIKLII